MKSGKGWRRALVALYLAKQKAAVRKAFAGQGRLTRIGYCCCCGRYGLFVWDHNHDAPLRRMI